jgi:hypothetical protein
MFMSNRRSAYTGAVLLLFASIGIAQAQVPVTATIPFDFVASGKTMPAGTYIFHEALPNNDREFAISDGRGHGALASAASLDFHDEGSKLLFRKHGDSYFLSDIFTPSGHVHFGMDRTESKLAKSASTQMISVPSGD